MEIKRHAANKGKHAAFKHTFLKKTHTQDWARTYLQYTS